MSKPILCYVALSPPARAALMTCREIGLDIEIRYINLPKAEHFTPEYRKLNPVGKVPTLIDGGTVVWDSHAICINLVEKYAANDSLYPKNFLKRTQVNQILFFEASYLFQRMYEVIVPLYFGMAKDISAFKIKEVKGAYKIIESFFEHGGNYLCGNELTIADLSVWSTLLSLKKLVNIEGDEYPKLIKWLDLMSKKKSYEENEKGADEHFAFIQRCIAGVPIILR